MVGEARSKLVYNNQSADGVFGQGAEARNQAEEEKRFAQRPL